VTRELGGRSGVTAGTRRRRLGFGLTRGLWGCCAGLLVVLAIFAAPAGAAEPCPNEAFRTGPSANLPDCRAYELVSASFEGGQLPFSISAFRDGGNELMLSSLGAFANAGDNPGPYGADYRLARGASGWLATPVEPAASQFQTGAKAMFQDVSQDFGKALFTEVPASAKAIDERLYIRRPDGGMAEVGPMVPPPTVASWKPGVAGDVPTLYYQGASQDLSHVLFMSQRFPNPTNFLWPGDTTLAAESLYQYVGTGNSVPALVGVDNAGHVISQCGTTLGHGDAAFNAISTDGATVFFTASGKRQGPVCGARTANLETCEAEGHSSKECEGGFGPRPVAPDVNELLARIDGARTVAISEPSPNEGCTILSCTDAPLSGGRFEGASADGSKVLFTSTQKLLDQASEDSTSGDGADVGEGCGFTTGANGCNLYMYDFAKPPGHNLVLLSGGDTSGKGPQVQGVSRISQDGSHVYFVAKGVLSAAANAYGQTAKAGRGNLYLYERDATFPTGRTAFIATLLTPESAAEREPKEKLCEALEEAEQEACTERIEKEHERSQRDEPVWRTADERPIQATPPDGRFLLFASTNDLTADASGSGEQLYRYDAQTGELIRISIGENGFNNNGNIGDSALLAARPYVASSRGAVSAGPKPVSITDDGAYAFFSSSTGLTPLALDNACVVEEAGECTERATNIYEYHAGHVYLISDGQDRHRGSAVSGIGASPSGSDVFFATADPLLPQDTNTQADVYDARIGGGFPAPANPVSCGGEAGCRAAPGAAPVFGAPTSSTYSGAGNLTSSASAPPQKAAPRSSTRAQKLARALKACRAKRRRQRAGCESRARKLYAATSRATKKRHGGGR
jgi:hypothetical protein